MKTKQIKRLVSGVIGISIALLSVIIVVAYVKQDAIVQSQIKSVNTTYSGRISVGDVHLAPFSNFPDIETPL